MNPREVNFRTMAEPTSPRWPATKILADLLLKMEESGEKSRR